MIIHLLDINLSGFIFAIISTTLEEYKKIIISYEI